MLNLLNREKRYFIRGEYLGRLLNVFLGVLIFSLAYYGILLFSNSFLVNFEKKVVESEKNNSSISSLEKELKEYEDVLKHIEAEYNLFSKDIVYPTDFISIINTKNISGIKLNSISFQKLNESGEVKLEIRGIAQNRDILISYSNSLKEVDSFKEVIMPISSLTKNIDIPFFITINAKIEEKK